MVPEVPSVEVPVPSRIAPELCDDAVPVRRYTLPLAPFWPAFAELTYRPPDVENSLSPEKIQIEPPVPITDVPPLINTSPPAPLPAACPPRRMTPPALAPSSPAPLLTKTCPPCIEEAPARISTLPPTPSPLSPDAIEIPPLSWPLSDVATEISPELLVAEPVKTETEPDDAVAFAVETVTLPELDLASPETSTVHHQAFVRRPRRGECYGTTCTTA